MAGLSQWRSPAVLLHFVLIFNDLIEYPAIIIDGYGLRKNLFQGIRLPCIEAGIDSFPSFCSNLSLRVSFGTGVG